MAGKLQSRCTVGNIYFLHRMTRNVDLGPFLMNEMSEKIRKVKTVLAKSSDFSYTPV